MQIKGHIFQLMKDAFPLSAVDGFGIFVGDKVFTVDSFQGRQDQAILISTVRTKIEAPNRFSATKSSLEFLLDVKRQSVAVSRPTNFLLISSNHEFIKSANGNQPCGPLVDMSKVARWAACDPGYSQPFPRFNISN